LKRIEEIIRTSDWSPALRKEFFAHLEKRMKDDARANYCRRKTSFLLRANDARHATWALELVAFALETFTNASDPARALLLAELANALDALGKKKEADAAYRKAKRLDPHLA
jgi:hypothetical protein